jgi:glycosyltransferase involved in cell wall biosynthesis
VRRLLVVSYLFPPLAGAGVYRWAKMAKFLPEFGWEPTVVTAAGDVRAHADDELAHDMPRTLRVRRVRDYGTKYVAAAARRLLKVPLMEGIEGWVPFATRVVLRELSRRRYDALCTTLGPFTLMKVGLAVRRRSPVPWVMDLRDPSWSHARGIGSPACSATEAARRRELEVAAYAAAARVVVVDAGVKEAIVADRDLKVSHVDVVPNGYDDDDFPPAAPVTGARRHFRVTFVGKLGDGYRADGLLRALGRLATDSGYRDLVRVTFAGELSRHMVRTLRRALPPECLHLEGYLPSREACRLMLESDLLLFVLPAYPNGGALRVHSKTYNYLRAGRPILAPIQPGAAADLLARSGAATVVPPDDDDAICGSLRAAVDEWWRGRVQPSTDWAFVRQYARRTLAQQLAAVLDAAVGRCREAGRSAA